MKKLLTMALGAMTALSAFAEPDHISLRGVDYTVDTIFHAKVGPGTTQTQLRLDGPSPVNVFYLTVDVTTPGVTIRTVSGTDKVAGTSRTSAMAAAKSTDGLQYFAGTNGDFYWTSGTATNGTSKVGTPTHSFVVENETFLSFNEGCQFIYDTNGVPYVEYVNYYQGTAACGDKTTSFKGINDPSSVADGLTLYTSRFWGSTNQTDVAGACYEVTARLVEGETFAAGGTYKIEVTSEPNTSGDTAIPADPGGAGADGRKARPHAAALGGIHGGGDQQAHRLPEPRHGAPDRPARRADEHLRAGRADPGRFRHRQKRDGH